MDKLNAMIAQAELNMRAYDNATEEVRAGVSYPMAIARYYGLRDARDAVMGVEQ